MTIIFVISWFVVLLLSETGKWRELFTRPHLPATNSNTVITLPFIPIAIAFFKTQTTSLFSFYRLYQISWLTIVEELIFRGLPFLVLDKTTKNFIILSFFFGLYGTLLGHVPAFFLYFALSLLYCKSGTYYSFVEVSLFRLIFNVLLFT